MENNAVPSPEMIRFGEKLQRMNDAIALKETDKIPMAPFCDAVALNFCGSNYKDLHYDFRKAGDAFVKFYQEYPMFDAHSFSGFRSGRANELTGTRTLDWPGRPGTKVADTSTHQVLEFEIMKQEEYPELLSDFTGFMLRKFLPRTHANVQPLASLAVPGTALLFDANAFAPFYNPELLKTIEMLQEVGRLNAEAIEVLMEYMGKLAAIGMPPLFSGITEAPYDILGDFFRGTIGVMEDLFEYEDEMAQACDIFADHLIAAIEPMRGVEMPVKRLFIPLHKGMDGFMNPAQYERLYWKPLRKLIMAIIDVGATPYVYTEGKYDTRLEYLRDVPKGKVIYHFEDVDMKKAKEILGGTACIAGNLPAALLEFGKKEEVVDYCKFLIDTCAPGGGYIFDFNAALMNAKRENFDAMVDVFETYK